MAEGPKWLTCSFEEFGLQPDVTAQMQQLYSDIDTVDFYVGIMLEQPPAASPELVFGEVSSTSPLRHLLLLEPLSFGSQRSSALFLHAG